MQETKWNQDAPVTEFLTNKSKYLLPTDSKIFSSCSLHLECNSHDSWHLVNRRICGLFSCSTVDWNKTSSSVSAIVCKHGLNSAEETEAMFTYGDQSKNSEPHVTEIEQTVRENWIE